jgi:hypothetical protein
VLFRSELLGQSEWLTGSQASVRVIVRDFRADAPLPARVTITLRPGEAKPGEAAAKPGKPAQPTAGKPARLFEGDTDKYGTLDAGFDVPDLAPGQYTLAVEAVSRLGKDQVERPITLSRAAQILLTTDKPLYQPGQVIHIRALALHQPSRLPVGSDAQVLEKGAIPG